jgi:hypothetical protein
VLRYLKGSVDHGLQFSKGSLNLEAFCDADWAGDPDSRRSTTGFGVFLGPCLVSWCAKKQPVVARSSTEAEYRALATVTTEVYWLRMLLKDLRISLSIPPTIWCDNIGALALASNPVYHARTKYVEVDYHFIREKVVNKDVLIKFISTHDQLVDIFTKGLTSARFCLLRTKLKVLSAPPSACRGLLDNISSTSPSNHQDQIRSSNQERQIPLITHDKNQITYINPVYSALCKETHAAAKYHANQDGNSKSTRKLNLISAIDSLSPTFIFLCILCINIVTLTVNNNKHSLYLFSSSYM